MAVSSTYNLLFIHIPKNAGTGVINQLNMKPHGHYDWRTHPNFKGNYTKFSIVRNPWCRLVSTYEFAKMDKSYWHNKTNHTRHPDFHICSTKSFTEIVNILYNTPHKLIHPGWKNQFPYICNEKDKIMVDHIIKMENLDEGLNNLLNKLGFDSIKLKKVNVSTRSSYEKYYNEITQNLVGEIYNKDIALFNYSFGKA